MGGHAAGEVASSLAVEALREVGESAGSGEAGGLRPKDVLDAVQAANRAILQSVARNPEQTGMATTLAGLARVTVGGSPHWAVFNIGDSRVYRVVDGRLTQVSTDHSEVAELVSLGLLTPQEALVHPARNIVTRCLGRDPLEPVDSWVFPPHAGERFLLCTDGLTNELRDPTIARILGDGDDPQAIADRLVGRRGRRRRSRQRDRGRGAGLAGCRRWRVARGRRGDRAAERFAGGFGVTGATIDVQRPPTGWSHLTGPLLHVLVALTPADPRYAAASAAADGGDLDDVLDALASEGMRRTPAFVAVAGASRPRVVTHADGYAVLTSARGTLEVRAHHTRVWSDLVADEDVDTVALRVSPTWVAPWLSSAEPAAAPEPATSEDRTPDEGTNLPITQPAALPEPAPLPDPASTPDPRARRRQLIT